MVPLQGAIAGCSGRGAIAGCLRRAIAVCYGWGEGDDQLWLSGRGAIAGCHCSVKVGFSILTNCGARA